MTRHCTIHNVRRVKTSSDHYALLATIHFHGYPFAGTPVLAVAWWNAGNKPHLTHHDLSLLAREGVQVILGCELRDRWEGSIDVRHWTDARGWDCYRGDHTVTSHETAVLMSPAIGRWEGFTTKAADGGGIGGGAGPDEDTDRFILRVLMQLPRSKWRVRRGRTNVIPMHLRPSWTWSRDRFKATWPQMDTLADVLYHLELPTLMGFDANGEQRTVQRRFGVHFDQTSPRIPTLRRWAPDFFATRAGRR